jgi:hypothetical protein
MRFGHFASLITPAIISLFININADARTPDYSKKINQISEGAPANMGHTLAPEAYVSFKTYKLPDAKVLYINFEEFEKLGIPRPKNLKQLAQFKTALIDCCAYSSNFNAEKFKTYYADRYGGWAIGHHAGTARGGSIGKISMKGSGKNPLGTEIETLDHANGAASFDEGIREPVKASLAQDLLRALILFYLSWIRVKTKFFRGVI